MALKEFDALPRSRKLAMVLFIAGAFGVTANVDAVRDFLRSWNAQHAIRG